MMGYGQPIMMPPPPRYPPDNGQGMPVSMPYSQAPPQGYVMLLNFPRGAVPHHPNGRGGPGSSPINLNAVMHLVNGALLPNSIAPWPDPFKQCLHFISSASRQMRRIRGRCKYIRNPFVIWK